MRLDANLQGKCVRMHKGALQFDILTLPPVLQGQAGAAVALALPSAATPHTFGTVTLPDLKVCCKAHRSSFQVR
jgi:hypothetical protein